MCTFNNGFSLCVGQEAHHNITTHKDAECDWDSIGATNVPFDWLLPALESDGSMLPAPKDRIVAVDITKASAIAIVHHMRKVHTRHAYKTYGLDKEGLLVDHEAFNRHKWIAVPEWKQRMESISDANGDSLELVEAFAVSLFVKRARGMDKVFVAAQKDKSGVWTDVRPSSTVVQPRWGPCDPSRLDRNEGTCGFCGKAPVVTRCARCQKVFYCDASCQSDDWSRHKQLCLKKRIPSANKSSRGGVRASKPEASTN